MLVNSDVDYIAMRYPDLLKAARRYVYLAKSYNMPNSLLLYGSAWNVEGLLVGAVQNLTRGAIYEG